MPAYKLFAAGVLLALGWLALQKEEGCSLFGEELTVTNTTTKLVHLYVSMPESPRARVEDVMPGASHTYHYSKGGAYEVAVLPNATHQSRLDKLNRIKQSLNEMLAGTPPEGRGAVVEPEQIRAGLKEIQAEIAQAAAGAPRCGGTVDANYTALVTISQASDSAPVEVSCADVATTPEDDNGGSGTSP